MTGPSNSTWTYVLIGAGIVVVGSVAYVGRTRSGPSPSKLPQSLQVASLAAQAKTDPASLRDTFRESMRSEELTEAQRRELASNMRQVFRAMIKERVDAWFAAETEAEKKAILDQQIDDFQARREAWNKRRAEQDKSGEDDQNGDRARFRQAFASRSKDERKARSESRNPDQSARRMAYFSAVRSRMNERGIKPPARRGGPWGRP